MQHMATQVVTEAAMEAATEAATAEAEVVVVEEGAVRDHALLSSRSYPQTLMPCPRLQFHNSLGVTSSLC